MYYGERLNSISHLVGAVLALVGLGQYSQLVFRHATHGLLLASLYLA